MMIEDDKDRSNQKALERILSSSKCHCLYSILHILGGFFYIVGSTLFLPDLYEILPLGGIWCYVTASLLYLGISIHDIIELRQRLKVQGSQSIQEIGGTNQNNTENDDDDDERIMKTKSSFIFRVRLAQKQFPIQEYMASLGNAVGAALFFIGSILFLPTMDSALASGYCFVIGSGAFLIGAISYSFQRNDIPDNVTSQLATLTAKSYVVGSIFFLAASLPYVIPVYNTSSVQYIIFTISSCVYVLGSAMFTLGGTMEWMKSKHMINNMAENPFQTKHSNEAIDQTHPMRESTSSILRKDESQEDGRQGENLDLECHESRQQIEVGETNLGNDGEIIAWSS